jgi:uracil-DNA glycosylase
MTDGALLSALDWWAEAGVDTLADDLPRNWLAAAPTTSETAEAIPAAAPRAPAEANLPDTLDAFRAFLLADATVPGPASMRIDAAGDVATGVVIIVDMPEAEDRASGRLLSGEVGALFDRMLGAIKLSREQIYLIPFSPARTTTGRLSLAEIKPLMPLLLHHLSLANPRKLLLLGDAPAQALLNLPAAKARETVHSVTIGETGVPTVASIHPRIVHMRRDYRPLAWADLQQFEAL